VIRKATGVATSPGATPDHDPTNLTSEMSSSVPIVRRKADVLLSLREGVL